MKSVTNILTIDEFFFCWNNKLKITHCFVRYNKNETLNIVDDFPIYTLIRFQVSGMLHNTGQSLVFRVDKDTKQHVNISGGPLAYRYQFEEIYIHYGTENQQGSEHHIHGYSFPAEVSLYI